MLGEEIHKLLILYKNDNQVNPEEMELKFTKLTTVSSLRDEIKMNFALDSLEQLLIYDPSDQLPHNRLSLTEPKVTKKEKILEHSAG